MIRTSRAVCLYATSAALTWVPVCARQRPVTAILTARVMPIVGRHYYNPSIFIEVK